MWRVFVLVCAAVVLLTGCPLDTAPKRSDTKRGVKPGDLIAQPGQTATEPGDMPTN